MPKIKWPHCVIVKGGFTRSCPRWTCVATTETSLKGLFWLFIVGCHGEGLCKVVRGATNEQWTTLACLIDCLLYGGHLSIKLRLRKVEKGKALTAAAVARRIYFSIPSLARFWYYAISRCGLRPAKPLTTSAETSSIKTRSSLDPLPSSYL